MSAACAGILDGLNRSVKDVSVAFFAIYKVLKKDLTIGKPKTEFNKICSNLRKNNPDFGFGIIAIICATSAINSADGATRIDSEGMIDRFIAYIMNYATIHQLTNLAGIRSTLESFKESVL